MPVLQVLQAAFGGSPSSLYGSSLKLLVASPLDACTLLANAGQVAGTVLLMQRGNCTFASKVGQFLEAGMRTVQEIQVMDQTPIWPGWLQHFISCLVL